MLDFAWSEFLLVVLLAVILIGPKQLPDVLYWLGRLIRRLQYMRFALSTQFDDLMKQAELDELRKGQGLGQDKFGLGSVMTPLPTTPKTITSVHDEADEDDDFFNQHTPRAQEPKEDDPANPPSK